jgi:hypothetical protein
VASTGQRRILAGASASVDAMGAYGNKSLSVIGLMTEDGAEVDAKGNAIKDRELLRL